MNKIQFLPSANLQAQQVTKTNCDKHRLLQWH